MSESDITIPPSVLEAAARAVYDRAQEDDLMPWSSLPEPFKAGWLTEAGVTIRAALAAWPGMAVNDGCPVWHAYPHIILPFTEKQNG